MANLDEREGFVVFTQRRGREFSFDCEFVKDGIISERAGNYFAFLGLLWKRLPVSLARLPLRTSDGQKLSLAAIGPERL